MTVLKASGMMRGELLDSGGSQQKCASQRLANATPRIADAREHAAKTKRRLVSPSVAKEPQEM